MIRRLRLGVAPQFNRKMVREREPPKLRQSSPSHLVACYQDQVKQDALELLIDQLLQKLHLRDVSRRVRFLLRVFLFPKKLGAGDS